MLHKCKPTTKHEMKTWRKQERWKPKVECFFNVKTKLVKLQRVQKLKNPQAGAGSRCRKCGNEVSP